MWREIKWHPFRPNKNATILVREGFRKKAYGMFFKIEPLNKHFKFFENVICRTEFKNDFRFHFFCTVKNFNKTISLTLSLADGLCENDRPLIDCLLRQLIPSWRPSIRNASDSKIVPKDRNSDTPWRCHVTIMRLYSYF